MSYRSERALPTNPVLRRQILPNPVSGHWGNAGKSSVLRRPLCRASSIHGHPSFSVGFLGRRDGQPLAALGAAAVGLLAVRRGAPTAGAAAAYCGLRRTWVGLGCLARHPGHEHGPRCGVLGRGTHRPCRRTAYPQQRWARWCFGAAFLVCVRSTGARILRTHRSRSLDLACGPGTPRRRGLVASRAPETAACQRQQIRIRRWTMEHAQQGCGERVRRFGCSQRERRGGFTGAVGRGSRTVAGPFAGVAAGQGWCLGGAHAWRCQRHLA